MKKLILLGIFILMVQSCNSKENYMDDCIEDYIEQGYSYREAKELCEDSYYDDDYTIRR